MTFGQAGLKRDDPDWYAALVLNEILGGGGFRGRLMKEIREKRGLAYGVSTGLVPYRHAGLILGSVATENGAGRRVDRADPRGVAADARRGPDRGRAARRQDLSDRLVPARPRIRRSASPGCLSHMQHDGLGIDYLDRRAELICGVTLDQARAVARRLYDPARLSFAVVGDPAGLQPTRPAPEQLD